MRRARWMAALALTCLGAGAALASTVIGLSVEDQARLATWVVAGEIAGQQGIDHPQYGIETAVTLRVTEVLQGDVRPGQDLVFHTRGGQVGDVVSEAVGEAVFKTGRKVLVFVELVDGRPYNLGLSYGVFDVHEDRRGRVSFTRAVQDGLAIVGGQEVGNGPFSMEDLAARVRYAQSHPRFDDPMVREAFGRGR